MERIEKRGVKEMYHEQEVTGYVAKLKGNLFIMDGFVFYENSMAFGKERKVGNGAEANN